MEHEKGPSVDTVLAFYHQAAPFLPQHVVHALRHAVPTHVSAVCHGDAVGSMLET